MVDSLTSEGGLRLLYSGLLGLLLLWAFVKGLARLLLFTLGVAGGGAAAWAWWRWGQELLAYAGVSEVRPEIFQWTIAAAGIAGSLVVRLLLHKIFRGDRLGPQGAPARFGSALLAVIPAALLLWALAMGTTWAGSVAWLHWVESTVKTRDPALMEQRPFAFKMSRNLSGGIFGNVLQRTDPLKSDPATALCTLIFLDAWGHTNDADLRNRLRSAPNVRALLENSAVKALLDDRDVLKAMSFSRFSEMISLPEISRVLEQPGVMDQVLAINSETCVLHALDWIKLQPQRAEVLADQAAASARH